MFCKDIDSNLNPKEIYDGHVFHHLLTKDLKAKESDEEITDKNCL